MMFSGMAPQSAINFIGRRQLQMAETEFIGPTAITKPPDDKKQTSGKNLLLFEYGKNVVIQNNSVSNKELESSKEQVYLINPHLNKKTDVIVQNSITRTKAEDTQMQTVKENLGQTKKSEDGPKLAEHKKDIVSQTKPKPTNITEIMEGRKIYGRVPLANLLKELNAHNYSNPHDFNYIVNPQYSICKNKSDIYVLTYVHTSPDHYKRRMVVRETWGNVKLFPELNMKVVFLMGKPSSRIQQDSIYMEAEQYNDIVQEDYIDSYKNLTYKGIMALKWISTYCKQAKYILKTDDDIFVNIFTLIKHLQSYDRFKEDKKLILCMVWTSMKVMREVKSKWYIPKTEFHDDRYSIYCSGSAFIMSQDVIAPMYQISLVTPFFWVDDFYLTGLLPQRIGVTPKNFGRAYYFQADLQEKFTGDKWYMYVFAHLHGVDKYYNMWKKVVKLATGKDIKI